MEDKQRRYLDRVVELLVSDTKIDYERNEILTPYFGPTRNIYKPFSFSTYCKKVYGLTEEEVGYVWEQYRSIIEK